MRLLERKKEPQASPCPRCSQMVADADGLVCPMCGWDLRDAYQGTDGAPHGHSIGLVDGHDAEVAGDRVA
jgi:hypothetical protein